MEKLLLADDSMTIQRVIELTFSGEDVQVVAVGDGEQAIARIPAERPDIVLADIGMPKRSGYDVAAFVKGHPDLRHIPVLLLAGAFEPVDEARAEQVGCDGVLVKPFDPQHVISRVRELLDGAKGSPTQAAAPTVARPIEKLTRAAAPESRPAGAGPVGPSLDDYFERLDSAFATRGGKAESIAVDGDADLGVPTMEKVLARERSALDAGNQALPEPMTPSRPIELPIVQAPSAPSVLSASMAVPPVEAPDTSPTLAGLPSPSNVAAGVPPSPGHGSADVRRPQTGGEADDSVERTVIADAFTALLALELGEPDARSVRLTTAPAEPPVTDALVDEVTRRVLERLAADTARAVVVELVSEIAERLVREEIARIRSRQ